MLALPSKGAFGSAVGADTAAGPPLIIAPGALGGPDGRSSAGMAGVLTSCATAAVAPSKAAANVSQTSVEGMIFPFQMNTRKLYEWRECRAVGVRIFSM